MIYLRHWLLSHTVRRNRPENRKNRIGKRLERDTDAFWRHFRCDILRILARFGCTQPARVLNSAGFFTDARTKRVRTAADAAFKAGRRL
jgi:hypothetical protein